MIFSQHQIADKENFNAKLANPKIVKNDLLARPLEVVNGNRSAAPDLEKSIQDWEKKLIASKDQDPLAIWDNYIRWAQQSKVESHFHLKLLKRCTLEYQTDPRYKNDPRYLRIWIKFIDSVENPLDYFGILEIHGIGTDLALLYTSWSLILEMKKGLYAEAYSKLEEGITKRARPQEQLQNALKQFEQRMTKRTMDSLKSAAAFQSASTKLAVFDQQIHSSGPVGNLRESVAKPIPRDSTSEREIQASAQPICDPASLKGTYLPGFIFQLG